MTGAEVSRLRGAAGVVPLLVTIVVSGVTTFMLYPLMALELIHRGFSAAEAGLVLGVLSGVGQLSQAPLGRLNAVIGSKPLAIGGLVARSVGLLTFLMGPSLPLYAVGAAVASLGSGANNLAVKTEIMRGSASRQAITMRSFAVNLGALIGPGVGAVLYEALSFNAIIILSVISYVLLSAFLLFVPFHSAENAVPPTASPSRRAGSPRLDRRFILLLGAVGAYWLVYSQWSLVVPIHAEAGFHTAVASSWVYTGNAVFILVLQYPIVVKMLKTVRSAAIVMAGFAAMTAGFVMLVPSSRPATVIGFGMLFSLGELLISPTLDEITARIRPDGGGMTQAFGIIGTVSGLGSLIGSPLGGTLIDHAGGVAGTAVIGCGAGLLGILAAGLLRPCLKGTT